VCGRRFSRKTIICNLSSLIDKEGYERGEKRRIEEICCLLSKRYLLLSYGAYRRVYIGRFSIDSGLVEDTDWYPENPFKSD
jgi:hypothetical protein